MRLRLLFLGTATVVAAWAQTPIVPPGSIVNGASFAAGQPIAGGALISIFGSNLATTQQHADSVPLSTSLGGVTVEFVNPTTNTTLNGRLLDTIPAAGQLNLQVPWNIVPPNTTQTVNVVVTNGTVSSQPTPVTIGPFSPGIFADGSLGIVQNNSDFTLAQPAGSIPGLTTHPAKPGDAVILYATGIGALQTGIADGAAAGQVIFTQTQPTVLIGGVTAQLIYSVISPQFVGLYQVAVFVPNVPAGNSVPVQIQMGGITTPATVTMAVSQ